MKQALIIKDNFNNIDSYIDLKEDLTKHNIKIVEIESIRYLELAKKRLDIHKPCLFYKDCYTRIDSPSNILDFHASNKFKFIKIGDRVVSFIPSHVTLKNNTLQMSITPVNSFSIQNLAINQSFKNLERPMVFLSTFNRDLYLKLTLNSLIFSLSSPIDIKIFLNQATPEVTKVALDFAKKYNFIEVLEVEKNSYFSVYNLAIQHFKPKNFIIMEDDILLSPATKDFFTNWAYQFIDRLSSFDAVGWGIYADNCHYSVPFARGIETKARSDWEIGDLNNVLCGAQCLAVSTKYWLETLFKNKSTCHYHVSLDQHLLTGNFCLPSLRTYHIGWNQEMEGFVSVNSGNRFGAPPLINKLKSLKTGEIKEFNLIDIYNYNPMDF